MPQLGFASVQGISGPALADLGANAEILIPSGCKLVDANTARVLLQNAKNPAPDNLLGMLVGENGSWWAVIQSADTGYITNPDKAKLNTAAILKTIQHDLAKQSEAVVKNGGPASTTDWFEPPIYDSAHHTLEYAIRAGVAGRNSVNYVLDLLGRHAVLSVTTVFPDQANADLSRFKEIFRGISFKSGERYGDHRADDQIAKSSLADLITTGNGATPEDKYTQADLINIGIWAVIGLALLYGVYSLCVLTIKSRKARYYRMKEAAMATPVGVNGNGHANGTNGSISANGNRRRKKMFSYHAFYSDMVMNLTRCGYEGAPGGTSLGGTLPLSAAPSRNGSNGSQKMPDATALLVTETSKLIESQQKLIEGQRRLIEEQSRLIQEKTRLLDAESKVLEKQGILISEQDLL